MKFLIVAAKTGGHIYPAKVISQELKERGHEIVLLGIGNQIEENAFKDLNSKTYKLKIEGFRGQTILKKLKVLGQVVINVFKVLGVIKKENIEYQRGGTYVVMEGPQFSTLAESNLYRSWKADVIGMTNMPEAKLAREAEIRYASVSMVTDYDCWHPDHENVDVQQVIKVLLGNAAKAKNMIKNLIDNFENHIDSNDPTNNCLDVAIITAPEKRTKKTIDKLKTIAGRVFFK